jgi:lysophospholipase L1-like esterase
MKIIPQHISSVLYGLLIVICFFTLHIFYQTYDNTLFQNTNWKSKKMELEIPVNGAVAFYVTHRALAGNHLDLSTWHGNQEVYLKNQINYSSLSFNFFLSKDATLYHYYGEKGDTLLGFKLTENEKFLMFFSMLDNCFEEKFYVPLNLTNNSLNICKIEIENEKLELFINNNNIYNIDVNFKNIVGFKGNEQKVIIDNIFLKNKDDIIVFKETFTPSWINFNLFLMYIAIVVFLIIGFNFNKFLFFYSITIFTLIFCIFSTYYLFHSQYLYPKKWLVNWQGYENRITNTEESIKNIDLQTKIAKKKYDKLSLFIGSSQTWGAGASKFEKSFVNLINKRLEECNKNHSFINTGISGLNSDSLLYYFKTDWIKYNPEFIIINLSNNDRGNHYLKENLIEFIKLSKTIKSKIIFVLEPNIKEDFLGINLNHNIMKEVAFENNILIIDMQYHINKEFENGILFWDNVHLTDFGQKVFAEYLWNCISPFLNNEISCENKDCLC